MFSFWYKRNTPSHRKGNTKWDSSYFSFFLYSVGTPGLEVEGHVMKLPFASPNEPHVEWKKYEFGISMHCRTKKAPYKWCTFSAISDVRFLFNCKFLAPWGCGVFSKVIRFWLNGEETQYFYGNRRFISMSQKPLIGPSYYPVQYKLQSHIAHFNS
jgi:hypothetical protein